MSKQDEQKAEAHTLVDVTLWFKGHHYKSQVGRTIGSFIHLYNVRGFLRSLLTGDPYLTWFMHLDDCCDYWTPIHSPDGSINPEVKKAFMLDDNFSLELPEEES